MRASTAVRWPKIYGALGACEDYEGLSDDERVALLQAQESPTGDH